MTDTSQGPGWWLASDGQWYPPESHPNYQPTFVPVPRYRMSSREVLGWFVMVAIGAVVGFLAFGGVFGVVVGAVFVFLARTVAWIATRNTA